MRSLMVEGSPTDGGLAGYLRKGIRNAPSEDGASQGDAALEIAASGQTFAEEGVDDSEYPTYRHPEEPRGEKQADLLGRAGEDLFVPSSAVRVISAPVRMHMGRFFQRYRPVEDGLTDEEGEEAGEQPGEQPGGHAAAQVCRDHGRL